MLCIVLYPWRESGQSREAAATSALVWLSRVAVRARIRRLLLGSGTSAAVSKRTRKHRGNRQHTCFQKHVATTLVGDVVVRSSGQIVDEVTHDRSPVDSLVSSCLFFATVL